MSLATFYGHFSSYLPGMATIAMVNFLGVLSPGPDFSIVVRNALSLSRQFALITVLGVALGVLFHSTYTIFGVGLLLIKYPWLMQIVKCLGCSYLIYIGYKLLKSQGGIQLQHETDTQVISAWGAFRMGLLTNLLNPKVVIFFTSLFTLVVDFDTPNDILMVYALECTAITWLWFSFLALVISSPRVKDTLNKYQKIIDKVIGVIFIGIAIELWFNT